MPRRRVISPLRPARNGVHAGLAFSIWRPDPPGEESGGIVVLHGAGSQKESHHDFARAAAAAGLAALLFDARGHGASGGRLGATVLEDVVGMAELLRAELGAAAPIALRGSSMGGYLALLAAGPAEARAVVAICPAAAADLARGLRSGRLGFPAEEDELLAFLGEHPLDPVMAELGQTPVLILHAEGDEQVPVEHSRRLARALSHPQSRLIAVPGGHHRSAQHDPELQAISLRFLGRMLGAGGNRESRR